MGDPRRPRRLGGKLPTRRILTPYTPREACGTSEAAALSGFSRDTVRRLVRKHGLGRPIGGHLKISRLAWRMFLDGDEAALVAYRRGDFNNPHVARYLVGKDPHRVATADRVQACGSAK